MIIRLNMKSDVPIYMQLRNEIVLGISKGELKIGEALPTVRQMAEDIGVNTMTVNKAYTILKQEGFIETDRRRGSVVCACENVQEDVLEKAEQELTLLIAEVSLKGMKKEAFMQMCEKIYNEMEKGTVKECFGREE